MPENSRINQRALVSMIRGKSIEVGIRYALKNDISVTKVKKAQKIAIEHYYNHSKHLNKNIVRRYEKQIPPLVLSGIRMLNNVNAKGYKSDNEKSIKIKGQDNFAYPDFKLNSINIDGVKIKNPTIELKTSEITSKSKILKAGHQSLKYKSKKDKNSLILYLSAKKTKKRYNPYKVKAEIFRVSENNHLKNEIFSKRADTLGVSCN